MSDANNVWVLIPLAAIAGGFIIRAMRIRHGLPENSRRRTGRFMSDAADESVERLNSLTAQNASLQSKINDLETRIRTLEKIATDPSRRLAEEIAQL
jgi:uncharacterized protein YlxW (UPF0749 family)